MTERRAEEEEEEEDHGEEEEEKDMEGNAKQEAAVGAMMGDVE